MKRITDKSKKAIPLFVYIMLIARFASSQNAKETFPVPSGNFYQLFYLQRTPNTNTIVYELNQKNGVLDVENPVHVFWIRYGEKGQREELSYIQRKFAYGIHAKMVEKDKYELRFSSYKKYVLYLMKTKDNKYHVYTTINGKMSVLSRIFIHIKSGGSFWSPNIDYVEINAFDETTGTAVTGTIKV